MAGDLNKVILIGRLTRDPEVRSLPSGTMLTTFSIANNRIYYMAETKKEEVSFFDCTAFGRTGETIAQYFKKGQKIAVEGRLRQSQWEDQEGKKRSKVEVVVENFNFFSSKAEDSAMTGQSDYGRSDYGQPTMGSQGYSAPAQGFSSHEQGFDSQGSEPRTQGFDSNPFPEDDIPF